MAAMKNLFFGKRSPDILGISGLRFRDTIPYLEPSGSYNYRCVDVNTTPKLSQILEIK